MTDGLAERMESAAAYLAAARRSGRQGDRIPDFCRPTTLEAAIKVQQRVIELLGESIGGWKCGLPPAPDKIFAAPIHASTITTATPCSIIAHNGKAAIEPEIAFVLACDLPPRDESYTEAEVRGAIGETRLALELIGGRFADSGAASFPELLADCLNNQGLFLGPVATIGPDQVPGVLTVTIKGPDGLLQAYDGRHPNDHPLRPLGWLVNFLTAAGQTLKAGQVVTTGSYAGVLEVPLGVSLQIEYGNLGILDVEFMSK